MPRGAPRLRARDGKKNRIAGRLKQRRDELGLTYDALAARVADATGGDWNPGEQDVLKIEHGTRMVIDEEIVALSLALSCNPCWLLLGEDSP